MSYKSMKRDRELNRISVFLISKGFFAKLPYNSSERYYYKAIDENFSEVIVLNIKDSVVAKYKTRSNKIEVRYAMNLNFTNEELKFFDTCNWSLDSSHNEHQSITDWFTGE